MNNQESSIIIYYGIVISKSIFCSYFKKLSWIDRTWAHLKFHAAESELECFFLNIYIKYYSLDWILQTIGVSYKMVVIVFPALGGNYNQVDKKKTFL